MVCVYRHSQHLARSMARGDHDMYPNAITDPDQTAAVLPAHCSVQEFSMELYEAFRAAQWWWSRCIGTAGCQSAPPAIAPSQKSDDKSRDPNQPHADYHATRNRAVLSCLLTSKVTLLGQMRQ